MGIFFDIGAGTGDDIKGFYGLDENHKNWKVYAFEANRDRSNRLKLRYPNITVVEAAAGTYNGTTTFYTGGGPNGYTTKKEKTANIGNESIVEVVYLCEYMRSVCSQEDNICMVIDIEGAEYEVVDALKKSELIDWIDDLYIEFHGEKLEGFDINIENEMIDYLIDKFDDKVYIYRKHQHEQFLKLNTEGS